MELTFDLAVRHTIGTQQNDAGPEYVPLGGGTLADNRFQPSPIAGPQPQRRCSGKGHDGTSMFTFEIHVPIIGPAPEKPSA